MKRTHKPLFTVICSLFIVLASCDKYEGPNLQDQPPASMNFTSWVYVVKDSVPFTTVNSDGEEVTKKADRTTTTYLLFESQTVGNIKTEVVSKKRPKLNHDTTVAFRYEYNKPNGILYHKSENQFGSLVNMQTPFVAGANALTVNWSNGTVVYKRTLD